MHRFASMTFGPTASSRHRLGSKQELELPNNNAVSYSGKSVWSVSGAVHCPPLHVWSLVQLTPKQEYRRGIGTYRFLLSVYDWRDRRRIRPCGAMPSAPSPLASSVALSDGETTGRPHWSSVASWSTRSLLTEKATTLTVTWFWVLCRSPGASASDCGSRALPSTTG